MNDGLILTFFSWFFVIAPRDILHIGGNFMHWAWRYFSIGYFLPRLLAPWHKDISGYGRGFDLQRFFHTLGWNLISRVIGAVMRLAVMAVGVLVEIILFLITTVAFISWYLIPLIVSGLLLLSGITLVL